LIEPIEIEIELEVACSPRHAFDACTDRSRATEVDISFMGDAAATTVTIVHRGWERLGADAPAWRQRNLGGWSGLLPHYRQAVGT
jgi:hypothetical protein